MAEKRERIKGGAARVTVVKFMKFTMFRSFLQGRG
jgi:hypothetical protein